MLKYIDTKITFSEVPDEISLCINISNCPIHCDGCHSKYLWEDVGKTLTMETLMNLIESNNGITCVTLLGGDSDVEAVSEIGSYIKKHTSLKTCWYSGRDLQCIKNPLIFEYFDYIKTGPYIKKLGGLSSEKTNQRFFAVSKVRVSDEGTTKYYYDFNNLNYKFRKYETKN